MKVAIIGCGLIGNKRAQWLGEHKLVVCADHVLPKATELANKYGARAVQSWEAAATDPEAEIAIVSTTHDSLAEVAIACIRAGKHVLLDKPGARRPRELEPLIETAERNKVKVRVGFNHRFHPALLRAKELVSMGTIGPLLFIRGRYGHGGRVGYEKEWRADPTVGGGGELLDQGAHLIDLSRWFLGDLVHVDGYIDTYFWDMKVEDNAFMSLRNDKNNMAWLHVSWTEWKNTFSFEIYGRDGKLQIDGLGGSYGVEQLSLFKMHPQMGPPETTIWQFPGEDKSWEREFNTFVTDINDDRQPEPNLMDAWEMLKVVEKLYGGAKVPC